MKILGILVLVTAAVTVTAGEDWQKVNVKKLLRERPQIFYKPNKPACSKGAGFYRDPQDCHQFLRCVDEFGTGEHFAVYVGRCEPGLVFDENVSACNWPQLAAPCSNSPPRLQEVRKPLEPEKFPNENAVYEQKSSDGQFPEEQIIQEIQELDSDTLQQEISAVEDSQIAQNPIYKEEKQEIPVVAQNPEEQRKEQIYQENIDAPAIEQQLFQEEMQAFDTQQQIYQENVQVSQEKNNHYEPVNVDSRTGQVSSAEFQQMLDQESSQQAQQETLSEWWIPEDDSQNNLPENSEQVPTHDPSQQPMFCSKSGFYRHPDNCSQFIRCVEIGKEAFAVHFFECPEKLIFDEKDNACIVSVQNCQINIRKKRQAPNTKLRCKGEGFFRHPVDCRAFYRCVKTETGYETHHFSCPANLVFDEEYTTCNWPEKAPPCNSQDQYKPTRKPVKPQPSSKPSNDFIDKSITQETYSKRRNTQKPKSTTQSYETGAKCRSPGFFRNENDCTKFHKCVKKGNRYIRYDLSCPKNFAYDDASQKCVAQRYATSCKRNKPYPPRQDDEETTVASETSSTSSSSSGSNNDATACEKEGYFRNPEDCNKFYRCVDFDGNGKEFVRYDFNCPEGLVFDEENSVCNWPDQSAPCDTRGSGEQGTGGDDENDESETGGNEDNNESGSENGENEISTSSEPSTSKPVESTSPSSIDEKEESDGSSDQDSDKESGGDGSNGECTKEGFYRNPEDCNKFYRCVDFDGEGKEFVRYDFSCPEGLVFDETNSVCNWPSDSEPCDTSSGGNGKEGNDQDGSKGTSSSTPSDSIESSEDHEDSSQNEQTTPSGNEVSENTPDDGSSDSSKDDSQSSTQSSNESTSESRGSNKNNGECTEEGFFRNPDDCNKFYRCVDHNGNGQFTKYDFTCPEGLVFDEANSVCNWPDQSAPCDGEGSNGGQGSTSGDGEGTESSQTTTKSSRSTSTETTQEITESSTSSSTERSQSTDGEESKSTTEKSVSTASDSEENDGTSDSSGSESGNNQGDCTEEGFFRNPEDCNKFYRCVDFNGDGQQFVRYDFECPEGLVFDEVNSVCNWPDQSPKCEAKSGSGSSKTTESSEETSTSQTESSSEQSQSSTTESSPYESTQGSTERSTQSSTEQSTSSSSSTSGDSSECTEPGFFRCKDDCNKFYRCVEEDGKLIRYDFKCPDGLIFDDKNKKCDWPSSTLTCEDSASSTTTSSYETSTSSTSTKSSTSSGASSKECTEEGFFRDPDDCSKYYRCIDEGDGTFTREDFSCAEDEVFDEEMRYCNRKDLAPPCDESETSQSQSTTSQTQTTAGAGSTSEGRSTTERSTTTQTTTESSTKSSSYECTKPGFFRCPEDCNKFYRCVEEEETGNLVRYDFHCPDGLIFDERNKKCDWPSSELTCDEESSTSASTGESTTAGSETGGSTSQGTSSSGTTSSAGTTSDECTEEGFFRNPDDCSKYYRCIDEGDGTFTREDFACEEDEVFDEEMRYCNRKDLAPPCDGSSSTTQTSESTKSQTSDEKSGSSTGTTSTSTGTTSSSDSGTDESSGTTSDSSASGECTEEGFHRDPNDCNKFYRCVDFKGDGQSFTRYDFECPEGLVFDETNDVCNWPSSVPSCESSNESRGSTKSESSTTKSTTEISEEQKSTKSNEQTSTTPRGQTSTTLGEQTSTTDKEQTTTQSDDSESTTVNEGTSSTSSNDGSTSSEKGTTSSGETGSRGSGSSDNIECTEEGFFRHPEDCSKFYRCVDFAGTGESYVRYDFDCPEGLVFDEVNSVCNWPNMSPGCESGSRAGNGNNEAGNTDSGESSSTDSNGGTSTSPSGTSTDTSRTTRQSESSTTPRDQTTRSSTSTTSSEGEFQCEEEGFFKHPTDCKKYYECKHDEDTGELVKIDCECPDGQVWDNEGWYCNAEELSPPCENDSSSSSFKCTKEGFFRDPEDCTRYYQCNKTGPGENDFSSERHQCDEGLVFDEEGRYCNAPELSEPCDDSASTSGGTTSSESSRGSTNDGSSSGTTSSGSSSGKNNCTSEGFFRNPDDCTKYYQCSRNEETGEFDRSDYSCPDGRIFDEVSNYCNEPELSEQPCDSDNNDQSTTSREASTQSSSSSNGGSSSGSTTSTGTRSGGPECTEEGFFRHPDDCNKFYRCVDFAGTGESFVRYDFDCPEGLHFDEVNSVCNWPTMSPPCESNNRVFLSNRAV